MEKSDSTRQSLIKKAVIAEWFLISYNILEGVASIAAGIFAGSIALVGFGLDSFIEVSSAAILIWRFAQHGDLEEEDRREKKALIFVGYSFFALAAYVIYESSRKLILHEMPDASIFGLVIATLSILVMPPLGLLKKNLAKQLKSKALEADAMETMICSYLSFTLLLGLGLNALFGWLWADPVAGLIMIYFLIKEGREAIYGDSCCGKEQH